MRSAALASVVFLAGCGLLLDPVPRELEGIDAGRDANVGDAIVDIDATAPPTPDAAPLPVDAHGSSIDAHSSPTDVALLDAPMLPDAPRAADAPVERVDADISRADAPMSGGPDAFTAPDAGLDPCLHLPEICNGVDDDCDRLIDEGGAALCAADRTCLAASCVCRMGTECDGVCTDTSSNPLHCGTCRSACTAGSTCVGAMCVAPPPHWTAVTVGQEHSCGLSSQGRVSCWGANDRGQLGDGSRVDRGALTEVALLRGVSKVDSGAQHVCAIATTGVHCWGANDNRQIGGGAVEDALTPRLVLGATIGVLRQISAGPSGTAGAGLTEDMAWGENGSGQLGDGTMTDRPTPVISWASPASLEEIQMGTAHSCARTSLGAVHCLGAAANGALGFTPAGGVSMVLAPRLVDGVTAVQITTNGTFTCARTAAGEVRCWGANDHGQCGQASVSAVFAPMLVVGLTAAAHISAGVSHACAVTTSGEVWCWGDNSLGQLGADTSPRGPHVPVLVSGLPPMAAVAAGGTHSCALSRAGQIFCWGTQTHFQLGSMVGSGTRSGPVAIPPPPPATP